MNLISWTTTTATAQNGWRKMIWDSPIPSPFFDTIAWRDQHCPCSMFGALSPAHFSNHFSEWKCDYFWARHHSAVSLIIFVTSWLDQIAQACSDHICSAGEERGRGGNCWWHPRHYDCIGPNGGRCAGCHIMCQPIYISMKLICLIYFMIGCNVSKCHFN